MGPDSRTDHREAQREHRWSIVSLQRNQYALRRALLGTQFLAQCMSRRFSPAKGVETEFIEKEEENTYSQRARRISGS